VLSVSRVRDSIPNAMRLGGAEDSAQAQSRLARAIYRDHLYCLVAMVAVLVLQLSAAL
jgi:hypothetical protein